MPLIPFPDVPALPGVPPLPRIAGAVAAAQFPLAALNIALWRAAQVDRRWGIAETATGKPLLADAQFLDAFGLASTLSTAAVEYSKEARISDFPIEGGGFASYNKVETPAEPVVTMALGGSEASRKAFLDALDAAVKGLTLYDVKTPEVTYRGYSVQRYSYQRRADRGATLLIVEITLREIRTVSAQYSIAAAPTKDVGAAAKADNGRVQAVTPKPSVALQISNWLANMVP